MENIGLYFSTAWGFWVGVCVFLFVCFSFIAQYFPLNVGLNAGGGGEKGH